MRHYFFTASDLDVVLWNVRGLFSTLLDKIGKDAWWCIIFGWYTVSGGGLLGWSEPLLLAGTVQVLAVSSELSVVTSVDEDDGCEAEGAGADIDLDGGSYLRSAADSMLGGAEWTPLLELNTIN